MEEISEARHGEPGHVCDRDAYPRQGDPKFVGPHVTQVIPACGSSADEWRVICACHYLSGLLPTRQAAVVSAWVHRVKCARAPRAQ